MKLYGSTRAWHVHTYPQNHVCEGDPCRRQKLFQSCKNDLVGQLIWEPFQGSWAQETAGVSGSGERFLSIPFAT